MKCHLAQWECDQCGGTTACTVWIALKNREAEFAAAKEHQCKYFQLPECPSPCDTCPVHAKVERLRALCSNTADMLPNFIGSGEMRKKLRAAGRGEKEENIAEGESRAASARTLHPLVGHSESGAE